jgi:serine/threonine-protein kinase HipA
MDLDDLRISLADAQENAALL